MKSSFTIDNRREYSRLVIVIANGEDGMSEENYDKILLGVDLLRSAFESMSKAAGVKTKTKRSRP